VFDDHRLARDLFARIADALPARVANLRPVGANERFRCYRYEAGQYFAPHRDGAFWRDDGERSLLTFMVYLNTGFDGGSTTFHEHGVTVEPVPGRALLFQHLLLHEGCEVKRGVKYALRSDIMFG
jgi:prolyl 4-hydroxylase